MQPAVRSEGDLAVLVVTPGVGGRQAARGARVEGAAVQVGAPDRPTAGRLVPPHDHVALLRDRYVRGCGRVVRHHRIRPRLQHRAIVVQEPDDSGIGSQVEDAVLVLNVPVVEVVVIVN